MPKTKLNIQAEPVKPVSDSQTTIDAAWDKIQPHDHNWIDNPKLEGTQVCSVPNCTQIRSTPKSKSKTKNKCPVDVGDIKLAISTFKSWLKNKNITGVGKNKVRGNPTKKDSLEFAIQALEWILQQYGELS